MLSNSSGISANGNLAIRMLPRASDSAPLAYLLTARRDVVCNECDSVECTVPSADLQRTLNEMELKGDVATEICLHCGAPNLAPGFSRLIAFVCDQCGEGVTVSAYGPDLFRTGR